MRRLKTILLHPIILSLVILGAIIILTPGMNKYRTELVSNKEISTSEKKLYYRINKKGEIAEIDHKLNVKLHTKNLEGIVFNEYFELDLDEDGEAEYLFLGENKQSMVITRNDLSHPTILSLPVKDNVDQIKVKYTNKIFPQLAINYGETQLYFNYIKNKLYGYRYLFFLLAYLAIFVILMIIRHFRNLYKLKKLKCEKEIAELKLKNIRNQLDPHFTLNVLNSIGYSFQSNDAETADYIFGKYSKLLRNTIFASSSAYSNLANELDYIQDYLDIEKFRMEDRFQYNIKSIPTSADKIIVPKMMLHTFVENAIKHGIKPLKRHGYLSIDFKEDNQLLTISIQDNGIGRKEAEGKSMNDTGKGLIIIEEMIELFFELAKIKIIYNIIDLSDENGNPKGTLIEIKYPLKSVKL